MTKPTTITTEVIWDESGFSSGCGVGPKRADFFKPLLDHQERVITARYECFRCGEKFPAEEISPLIRKDNGEWEEIYACHKHARELKQEGWLG